MDTKKAKYTPGPWRLEKYTDRLRVQNAAGVNVAEVIDQNAGPLLAAAPELLAALERILECHNNGIALRTNIGAISQMRAAIAKAKGE